MEDVNIPGQIFLSHGCCLREVHFWHFEQVGINATKFGKKQIHFNSYAFEAGTVFVAKAP